MATAVAAPAQAQAAWNLTVSAAPTAGVARTVNQSGGITFAAIATGANLSVTDIATALSQSQSVVVSTGTTGAENGDMTIEAPIATVLDNTLSFQPAGVIAFNGGSVTTGGNQSYDGPVELVSATTITSIAGTIDFSSTVDGGAALTVDTLGTTSFGGAVGGSTPLSGLSVSGATALDGTGVSTSGDQTYIGPVVIGGDNVLSGANVTFGETVNGAFALQIDPTGVLTFDGDVGGAAAPSSLTVGSSGSVSLVSGSVVTSGGQTYGDQVNVLDDITLDPGTTATLAGATSLTGTLSLQGSGAFQGAIAGTGGIVKRGTGTLSLADPGTYGGGTFVEGGTVNFAAGADFGSGVITLDGGGLQWATGNSSDVSSQLGQIGGGGATFDTNGNHVTFASSLNGPGAIVKTGAGTLNLAGANSFIGEARVTGGTLDVTGTLPSMLNIFPGATATVSGSVMDGVNLQSSGTLNCNGGTILGGVDNLGGVETGAPDSPSVVSALAGNAAAVVSFTPGGANCFPVTYTATASPGGASASGSSEPLTVGRLHNGTGYTFTVTATNPIGGSAPSPASGLATPQGGPPSVRILSPGRGGTYRQGEHVVTRYSCSDASDSPGIAACFDSTGNTGGSGHLYTDLPGDYIYTVTARSRDGQTATTSISYRVVGAPQVSISSPNQGQRYALDLPVDAAFVCQEGANGPGLTSCKGSKAQGAAIGTAKLGVHTLSVTARSRDGQSTTKVVTYTVVAPTRFTVWQIEALPDGTLHFLLTVPGPGTLHVLETVLGGRVGRHGKPGALVFAIRKLHAGRASVLDIRVLPSRAGQRLLGHHRHPVVIKLSVTFSPRIGRDRSFRRYGIDLPAGGSG